MGVPVLLLVAVTDTVCVHVTEGVAVRLKLVDTARQQGAHTTAKVTKASRRLVAQSHVWQGAEIADFANWTGRSGTSSRFGGRNAASMPKPVTTATAVAVKGPFAHSPNELVRRGNTAARAGRGRLEMGGSSARLRTLVILTLAERADVEGVWEPLVSRACPGRPENKT